MAEQEFVAETAAERVFAQLVSAVEAYADQRSKRSRTAGRKAPREQGSGAVETDDGQHN